MQHALVFGHGTADRAAFDDARAERLLGIQILARLRRRDGDVRVPEVGRGVHHGIDIAARQHFAKVAIHVARIQARDLCRRLAVLCIDITDGDDLHTLIAHQGAHVARALPSDTDAGEAHFAVGRDGSRTTERRCGDDERTG